MAKELSRKFRPEHRDIEIIYEDALSVKKFLYIGLPANVQAKIDAHFAEEDALCEAIKAAANV